MALASAIVASLVPEGIDIDVVFILVVIGWLRFGPLPAASALRIILQRPLLKNFYLVYS
jgi:hypothetical protein